MFERVAAETIALIGVTGRFGTALEFWIYNVLKITSIMVVVIFGVSYLRTYLPQEKIRDYLWGKKSLIGYGLAALLGTVSPFCSCSTIPLFLGFIGAGVPFGMTITFLFVSPMVNTAAVFVLLGSFGWQLAIAYTLGGLGVGMAGGAALSWLGMERYVPEMEFSSAEAENESGPSALERAKLAFADAKEIVARIFPYVLVGVGIGAGIHGYLPEEFIAGTLQGSLAIPAATALGVPVYTNILGVIPVAESLIGKGLPTGTAISFMMSVAALSVPQFVMLKQAMKKQLIVTYGLAVAVGIMAVGFVLNLVF